MKPLGLVLFLFSAALAMAQTVTPGSTVGSTTLVANTSTVVGSGLTSRKGISVQNLGSDNLWCGMGNRLTDGGLTIPDGGSALAADAGSVYFDIGMRIATNQVLSFDQGYQLRTNSDLICMTPTLQVSPNNTRWTETR